MTSALTEVSVQLHAPATLLPEKEPSILIGKEARWASQPVWTIWRSDNFLPCRDSNPYPSVAQPLVNRYTDFATAAICILPAFLLLLLLIIIIILFVTSLFPRRWPGYLSQSYSHMCTKLD
jgi:hypothetical protein